MQQFNLFYWFIFLKLFTLQCSFKYTELPDTSSCLSQL